jgi:hypothetical protein
MGWGRAKLADKAKNQTFFGHSLLKLSDSDPTCNLTN